MYFTYGETEISYLKRKDRRLSQIIDQIGLIQRPVDADLFSSVIHHIIGQQISTKAQQTIWKRMQNEFGTVTADTILAAGNNRLQSLGITFRKAEYITDFAQKVKDGSFDLEDIWNRSDEEAIAELISLKGIGVWTAELILLFCMQRPNIFSYGDLAILRGIRMVYHHRRIDRNLFEKYRRRFSPYCSVASLYFWAVAGGAIPEMKDYAPKGGEKQNGRTRKNAGNSNRDKAYDGKFIYGVKTTRIICKPGCPAKIPLEKNIVFFDTLEEAVQNGYRFCKRCRPEE